MTAVRYLVAAVAAFAVTFGLFFLMQELVAPEDGRLKDDGRGDRIDFIRLKRESITQTRKREMPKRAKPQQAPTPPPMPQATSQSSMPTQVITTQVPVQGPTVDLGGPSLGDAPADTDVVPLVRIAPQYPTRALSRGLEGWVEVSFTISPEGTVEDPVVVGRSSGSTVFDREALRAIRKWKYKPKIEDGVAVPRPGVQVRLTFSLENT